MTDTNRPNQVKKYMFTWNNYPEDWKQLIAKRLEPIAHKLACQAEIGDQGTPHIQGAIVLKRRMRWSQFGLPKEIHWENMKGNENVAIAYALKESTRDTTQSPILYNVSLPETIKVLQEPEMLAWQKETVEIIKRTPSDRIIYWRWDHDGKCGKSALVKLLCYKYGALMVSGSNKDMKSAVARYKEEKGVTPKILIYDIPRMARDYVSYTGIEELKNGCFLSTKYEVKMVIMNSPHILCFANFEPDFDALSSDRWDVREIELTQEEEDKIEKGILEQHQENHQDGDNGENEG